MDEKARFEEYRKILANAPYVMPMYPENGKSFIQHVMSAVAGEWDNPGENPDKVLLKGDLRTGATSVQNEETATSMQPEIKTGIYALFQKVQNYSGAVWVYAGQERDAHMIANWVREQTNLIELTKNHPSTRILEYKIVHLED